MILYCFCIQKKDKLCTRRTGQIVDETDRGGYSIKTGRIPEGFSFREYAGNKGLLKGGNKDP